MSKIIAFFRRRKTYNPEDLRKKKEQPDKSGWNWRNDYSEKNLRLHIEAARLIGINDKIGWWSDLGKALGLDEPYRTMPLTQNALALRIGDELGVEKLPQEQWHFLPPANWYEIARKLGLGILRIGPSFSIPIPFIIYAFTRWKKSKIAN